MLSNEPFWRAEFPRPEDLPVAVALPESVDVAIVGSGYTGFYRNEPWFVPLAARCYRFLDWLS